MSVLTHIPNRLGKKMVLFIDTPPDAVKGLAFILHGYMGCAEEPHIVGMADALVRHGYRTVRIDATNSFNRADGLVEDCTPTTHLHDLEDAIAWARIQDWFQEPFVLAGHSLGGLAVATYAQAHPETVKAVAPCSTVVSGTLRFASQEKYSAENMAILRRDGFLPITNDRPFGPRLGRKSMKNYDDTLNYDLLPKAGSMPMPVGLFVARDDDATPYDQQQMLFDALPPATRSIAVFDNGGHCYWGDTLPKFLNAFDGWIGRLS